MSFKNKPVIGISTNILTITDKPFVGHERIYVNQGYVESVTRAGGIPLLLPIVKDLQLFSQILPMIDGLLLTGGQDVHPLHYNEEPHPKLGRTVEDRDKLEFSILSQMQEQKKPILGVCRGMQLINVAFGGTLYQDIPDQIPLSTLKHAQEEAPQSATHKINIVKGSFLETLIGDTTFSCNSLHHQAVKDLASGFIVNAKADDGVIEAIVHTGPSWIVGVQWHPEMLIDTYPVMNKLFEAFIKESARRASGA